MNNDLTNPKYQVVLFENTKVRRVWHEERWFYSVVDIVAVLTESDKPRDYWYRLRVREEESGIQLSTVCRRFKLKSEDGKLRETESTIYAKSFQ
jgi:hypothetical protein